MTWRWQTLGSTLTLVTEADGDRVILAAGRRKGSPCTLLTMQADGKLEAATGEEPALRKIAAVDDLVEALKAAEHGMTAAHNLRATDLSVEAFDGFLAAGRDREDLEFMTDFEFELTKVRAALAKAGL